MRNSAPEIAGLVEGLTRAWNAGDSRAFAAHFSDDCDLVNIHGMRLHGRASIAGVYDMLFRSVFRRSRIDAEICMSRALCSQALAVQVRVALHVPGGSLQGDHDAVCSLILQRHESGWLVGSLHNTLVSEGAERRLVA